MATISSAKSGPWSDTATWVGGVIPGPNDVADLSNNTTITVDQNIVVQALTHVNGILVHSSGSWTMTFTAWQVNTSTSGYLIRVSGGTATFLSTLTAGISTDRSAVDVTGIGTVANFATVNGGSGPSIGCVNVRDGATVNVTTATGGGNSGIGVTVASGGIANVTNANGSNSNSIAVKVLSGGVTYITTATGAGTLSTSSALEVASGGVATITTALGGAGDKAVNVVAGGIATITNSATASASAPAVVSAGYTRASGDLYSASNGRFPISGTWGVSGEVRIHMRDDSNWPTNLNGTSLTLSRYGSDNPNANDVRKGITYGPSGVNVGTLAVPSPASVAIGVPTDNTVGTATLDKDILVADIAAITGAQIAAALTSDNT